MAVWSPWQRKDTAWLFKSKMLSTDWIVAGIMVGDEGLMICGLVIDVWIRFVRANSKRSAKVNINVRILRASRWLINSY